MIVNDLTKTHETKINKINHWLEKEYGVSISTDTPISELYNAKKGLVAVRNKLVETGSFNSYHKNQNYMKTMLMLEAVNMLIEQQLDNNGRVISEQTDEMENAQILLAAQDMVDKLAGMAEDIAELQTKALMPLVDEIKYNVGQQQAQAFNDTAKAQLQGALDAISSVKDAMGDQVLALQGGQMPAPMPAEAPMGAPVGEPEDMLGGAEEMAGPVEEPLGREPKF